MGSREAKQDIFSLTTRYGQQKLSASLGQLRDVTEKTINQIQNEMLAKQRSKLYDESLCFVSTWAEFTKVMELRKLAVAQWCGTSECEAHIKKRFVVANFNSFYSTTESETKVKHLNVPFEFSSKPFVQNKCFACDNSPNMWVLYGRSY